jgi:hypothetical protein
MYTLRAVDELRKGLVSCTITPALRPSARQMIDKILASSVIHRPRLFIKPEELNISLTTTIIGDRPWEPSTDIVSKGILLQRPGSVNVVCVRCGGKSEAATNISTLNQELSRWRAWESLWSTRCVCGGAWVRSPITL